MSIQKNVLNTNTYHLIPQLALWGAEVDLLQLILINYLALRRNITRGGVCPLTKKEGFALFE